uniref:Uncharacterized protein n=1 Tax=Leersia perrieri TaxID=77586 RepID=A0A0D9W0N9_9ORYZ
MALERRNGGRNKHSRGHVKMMARVQVVVRRLLQLLPYLRLVAAVAVFLSSDPYYHALTF